MRPAHKAHTPSFLSPAAQPAFYAQPMSGQVCRTEATAVPGPGKQCCCGFGGGCSLARRVPHHNHTANSCWLGRAGRVQAPGGGVCVPACHMLPLSCLLAGQQARVRPVARGVGGCSCGPSCCATAKQAERMQRCVQQWAVGMHQVHHHDTAAQAWPGGLSGALSASPALGRPRPIVGWPLGMPTTALVSLASMHRWCQSSRGYKVPTALTAGSPLPRHLCKSLLQGSEAVSNNVQVLQGVQGAPGQSSRRPHPQINF